MKLYELMIKEFLSIVEALEVNQDIENNRIVIEKEHFRNLLEKYSYMNFKEKTRVYKNLNFIIHDKNNYTMPCKVSGKTARKVVINYKTYLVLKDLQKEVN